jgi:hemerythrin-like metal-binding protein
VSAPTQGGERHLKWGVEYSVGIDTIDAQHRHIFEQLLAIENAVEKRDPWHIVRYLLEQLSAALQQHFALEEALLEIIAYPQMQEHRASHGRLRESMAALEISIRDHRSPADLVKFFEQWFVGHVLTSDRLYAAYAREKLALG